VGVLDRTGDQIRVFGKVIVRADVDNHRAIGQADQTQELFASNFVWGSHSACFLSVNMRTFGLSLTGLFALRPIMVFVPWLSGWVKS
jgi:hypothetical protein